MNIILLESVEKLGTIGDEVVVKNGYARNFLIPQGKALRSTNENRAYFESQKAVLEKKNDERKEQAQAQAKKLEDLHVTIIRQAGDDGRLYGSVNARDIASAVGNDVHYSHVRLDKAVKELGVYPVNLDLHVDVKVEVLLVVARSEGEGEESLKQYKTPDAQDQQDEAAADAPDSADDAAEASEETNDSDTQAA